ncbi:MAG: radical SAM protein [Deltaproteobacteria bacterium]|nr:radical SAM protein [Deltaproteobacteria bacterium]
MSNIVIQADSNFHNIAGKELHTDGAYAEYRRKWKEWPENFHVGEFPLFIDVEVTSGCNLKCPFCVHTHKRGDIRDGLMRFETFKRLIDEGVENELYGVKFNIRGEPCVHPDIAKFVAYAKSNGLKDVYFNTNAMLLTEGLSRELIDAELDRISVSFEGYSKKVYESYRVGADFDTVVKNIETLQKLKKARGVEYPKVRVQMVRLPELEGEVEGYRNFWAGRVEEVAFIDYQEMSAKKKGIEYPWACPQLWQRMAIFWNGIILPCNHDFDALNSLGNVTTVSIKKAWHSAELNNMRKIHRTGCAHRISACDGCYLRDSEILKLTTESAR